MTKKIIVFGSRGQVGQKLLSFGSTHNLSIIGFSHGDIDITKERDVIAAIQDYDCDLVINAAAYTNVDGAEGEKEKAFSINFDGPAILAQACCDADIPLIHISTDYVFDGMKECGFIEDDPMLPLGVYGKSKLAGERAVRELLKKHIILRTSWVYSSSGNNFVKTMLNLSQEREELKIINDQIGCPTAAFDIAKTILELWNKIFLQRPKVKWGTFHYCGDTKLSWYEFACEIFRLAEDPLGVKTPKLYPVSTDEYPTIATRPSYSVLDCSRIGRVFGIYPAPFLNSLSHVIGELKTLDNIEIQKS